MYRKLCRLNFSRKKNHTKRNSMRLGFLMNWSNGQSLPISIYLLNIAIKKYKCLQFGVVKRELVNERVEQAAADDELFSFFADRKRKTKRACAFLWAFQCWFIHDMADWWTKQLMFVHVLLTRIFISQLHYRKFTNFRIVLPRIFLGIQYTCWFGLIQNICKK